MYSISWLIKIIALWFQNTFNPKSYYRKPNTVNNTSKFENISTIRNRKKPEWVVDKVIYLKALMPDNGCGSIADIFNRLYLDKGETVSKTYVYEKLKTHAYQVKCKRRKIKSQKPKATAINKTWGIDLTTVTIKGKQELILGVIDHGSRALLCLQKIDSKHSLVILKEIINTIRQYGLPKIIRSDNESCFTSKLMKVSLKLLSIKGQTSDIACPWQNGRIERCFGTFKSKWQQYEINNNCHLQAQLTIYQTWYNAIRPHSNLDGQTPKEIFSDKKSQGKPFFTIGWNGVLTGYYFPD